MAQSIQFYCSYFTAIATAELLSVQDAERCCMQGRHTDRLITVCYLPVTLVMLLVMIHYNHRTNIALRISGGMAGFCLSMIAVPLVSLSILTCGVDLRHICT